MFAAPASYTPPHLVSRAASVVEPKGSGTVLVQVQVNADGTFKVLRVIRSTNPGDNAAALDIAQHSKYAPAMRDGKPTGGFYDFEVKFASGAVSGAGGQIASMLHNNQFDAAKAAADQALAQNPGNQLVQAQLGVADAFLHDIPGSVAAFDKAGEIPSIYQNVAMQAYSLNAVSIAGTQPAAALVQAQKAVSMDGDYGAYYALGVAQHANKQDSAALASLKKALAMAKSANPAADSTTMTNIYEQLLTVAQAAGDKATADQISAELGKSSPGMAGKSAAFALDQQAGAYVQQHNDAAAIATFEKAAATDPSWAGGPEYTKAAIVYASEAIPNFQASRLEAEKAIAADPNYAIAYYVAAVAMGADAQSSGNMDEMQRSEDYANKAADLATKAGQTQLATSAKFYAIHHTQDSNLQFWSTQLSTNPAYRGQLGAQPNT